METLFQILPGNWTYALGWTMVHSLWQGALLAILLSVFRWFTARSSPHLRYLAGLVSLGSLFALSVLTFSLLWESGDPGRDIVITMTGNAEPVAFSGLARLTAYLNRQLPLLVAAWVIGMLFFAVRTAGGLWYVSRLRKTGNIPADPGWQMRAGQMASRMKIRRPVSILESAQVAVPLVIGHFKPLVLLPVGMVNQLTPAEVEAILAHELAHIRRHDFLLNLLQSVLDILYYFNPAVWYISSTIRNERENSCDDWAVSICGNSMTYVRALVQLQERAVNAPQLALSLAKGGKPLLNRVRRILNQPNNKKTVMERFFATVLLLAAVAIFSVSANRPDDVIRSGNEAASLLVSAENGLDTIPPVVKEEVQIVKEKGDRRMELTLENGEVVEFKVDGKVIPKEEQGPYQKDIDAMRDDLPEPPQPPAPPAPPAPGMAPGAPLPPGPPAAPRRIEKEIKVTTQKLDDGKVMIRVDEDSDEPIEIIVDGEDVEVITLPREKAVEDFGLFFEPQMHERALKEHQMAMEEHERALREQGRDLERQMEIMKEKHADKLQEVEKHMRDFEVEVPRIMPPEAPFIWNGGRRGSLKADIERELRRDGFIDEDGSYKFELSGKKLMINGKKESDAIFEKYRKIYEKNTGVDLSKNSKIQIEE